MNSSLEILSRRLRLLCSLILLYALTICISAAKFCVSETSRDSARAARFCVQTDLKQEDQELFLSVFSWEKSVKFSVSNYNDEIGVSEVRIEYDLIFTFPKKDANQVKIALFFIDKNSETQLPMQRKDEGQNAVFTCPRAGIFEAGKESKHSYSLRFNAAEIIGYSRFKLNLFVSARQIFSEG